MMPATACPFCTSGQVEVDKSDSGYWSVRCGSCGSRGPETPERDAAFERWARPSESAQLLRTVIDESPDVILLKNWDGQFLLGNRALADLYGTTPDQLVGHDDGAFNPNQEQVDFYLENVRGVMRGGETQIVQEDSTDTETGEVRHFQSIKKPIKGPDGELQILVIAHDVTDLYRAHRVIEERERSYSYAMAAAGEGIWDWDLTHNVVTHNAKWCELFGFDQTVLQHPIGVFTDLLHEDDRDAVSMTLQEALAGSGEYHHEHRMRRRNGDIIWVLDRGSVVERDEDGNPTRMAGSATDITSRIRDEQRLVAATEAIANANILLEQKVAERTADLERVNVELEALARRDPLTDLPNRLAGNERLHDDFARMSRSSDSYAVLMMDVDWFKKINDTYGHSVGDDVLRHVADIIRGCIRETDFVARVGGEEFMALLPHATLVEARMVADKIRESIEATPDPRVGTVTISIGVADASPQQVDADVAVRHADAALYQAKRTGRNRVVSADATPA